MPPISQLFLRKDRPPASGKFSDSVGHVVGPVIGLGHGAGLRLMGLNWDLLIGLNLGLRVVGRAPHEGVGLGVLGLSHGLQGVAESVDEVSRNAAAFAWNWFIAIG